MSLSARLGSSWYNEAEEAVMQPKSPYTSSPRSDVYKASGVDTDEANVGLKRLTTRIMKTWPVAGQPGEVRLDIGYFANVVDFGDIGVAICTDGVGSKALIATMMEKYDTIGIDCVAMNVNDVICVGAKPISMVDYIAIEKVDAEVLDQISIGLAKGAKIAEISISGGEISQLKGILNGFDLVGMAVGRVALDKINVGEHIRPNDILIGIESDGIHSNGLTLARRAFFELHKYGLSHRFPNLTNDLGTELLKPTAIYVKEVLEVLDQVDSVKALVHITSDGFLNLTRVKAPVGYVINALPPIPPIFSIIQKLGGVESSEMFEVYNMGIGFCIVVSPSDADRVLSIVRKHGRHAHKIGYATDDPGKHVILEKQDLVGQGKRFRPR
jgi:phosphoribosylformylglycinamidine cyclo-ligase